MTGIGAYADLLSHSATVEEVHELAALLARVVTVVRVADVLLPAELVALAESAAGRSSVARRLNNELPQEAA